MQKKIYEPTMFKGSKEKIIKKTIKTIDGEKVEIDGNGINSFVKHGRSVESVIQDILTLFPDINLSIETMVSLILSPNDMGDPKLTFKLENAYLPSDVKNAIIGTLTTYVNSEYKLVSKLDEIVTESLYTKGAYIELNIPPKNILDLLNMVSRKPKVGIESALNKISFLKLGIGEEVVDKEYNVEVTDNQSYLFIDLINEVKINSIINHSILNRNNTITTGLESLVKLNNDTAVISVDKVGSGKPIIKKLSASSVMPVSSKDDPSIHYGYFIVLDENGRQVVNAAPTLDYKSEKYIKGVKDNFKGAPTAPSTNIKKLDKFREVLLKQILSKYLDKSIYKDLVSLDIDIDNSLMESIADYMLKKSKLKIVFVPQELVSYYAVNYRPNGTGEPLLERIITLASIRGIILYTNLLSFVKSSLTTTNVNVNLDPDDPNYRKTAEQIMAWVLKNRQIELPIGLLKAEDFVDWAKKLGISFNFKHPGLPDVDIEVEEKNTEIKPIDTDLKETVDKHIITALLLTPEMLDNDFNPEFATSIIAKNKLLAKRVKKIQRKYDELMTKDIVKKLTLDSKIKETLKDIIINNDKKIRSLLKDKDPNIDVKVIKKIDKDVLAEYVISSIYKNLTVTLPAPEVTEDRNSKDRLDNFLDMLDTILDKILSTDLIPDDLLGDLGDKVDNVKDAIKVILIKRFVDENNILPEVTNMFLLNEDGEPNDNIMEDFKSHIDAISKIIIPFIKDNTKFKNKVDDKLDKIENEDEGGDENNETDSGENNTGETNAEGEGNNTLEEPNENSEEI